LAKGVSFCPVDEVSSRVSENMYRTGKETVPNTQQVIYELATWEVVFNGRESDPRQTTTIDNTPQWLIQGFQRLQTAKDDDRLLAATASNKDTMDIDIGNLTDQSKH
jgi:hypothetical protein